MAYLINLKTVVNETGKLTVIEKEAPFTIKRSFFIYGLTKNAERGCHRHIKAVVAMVCIKGSCEVYVNNGRNKEIFTLDNPAKGLIVEPGDWHKMYNFKNNAILIVFASEYYDPDDFVKEEYK